MPTDTKPKGHFEPIHAAHAIEQVAFILQMEQPLAHESFSQICEIAKQFKTEADMPGQPEFKTLAFAFGPAMPQHSPPPSPLVLNRMAADGTPEKELRVDVNSISFTTFRYTRWEEAWSQARRYFEALVPTYIENTKIAAMGLNYIDKFKWVGELPECKTNILMRSGSKYLCPHIFEADDFWHSYTGAFIRADKSTKRLLNVNVDYLDEIRPDNIRRVVAITTVLTDLMNQPGYDPFEVNAKDAINFLDARMQNLHVFGKEVFGDIISDEMSKRIALI
jgi:uncharacterized protein (TIGR04255 family)